MINTRAAVHDDSSQALSEFAERRFSRLCAAAGFENHGARALSVFRSVVMPAISSGAAGWVSDISDEQTPIEFSVALHGDKSEVRVLFEAQGKVNTVDSYRTAAIALTNELSRTLDADLTKFKLVSDLFLPAHMFGPFALWHSLVFKPDGVDVKVYFNAQARGVGHAYATVEEALSRLGLSRAWSSLVRTVLVRGPKLDEMKYLALDLSSHADARVKVYVRHHSASIAELEHACSGSGEYVPGEAADFARALSGGAHTLQRRAPFTCSAFSGASHERPSATTLYVPVCAYASDDAAVIARVSEHLAQRDLPALHYGQLIADYADRELTAGVGLQSWVAFRRLSGKARLTVYLSTESRGALPPGTIPAPTSDRTRYSSVQDVLDDLTLYPLSSHPLIRLLKQRGAEVSLLRAASAPLSAWLSGLPSLRALTKGGELLGAGDVDAQLDALREAISPLRRWAEQSAELGPAEREFITRARQHLVEAAALERAAAFAALAVLVEQATEALGTGRTRAHSLAQRSLAGRRLSGSVKALPLPARMLSNLDDCDGDELRHVAAGATGIQGALFRLLDALYLDLSRPRTLPGATAQ